MFRAADVPSEVVGNIGRPLTSLVGAVDERAWLVCEVGVVPARRRRDVPAAHRRPPQPRARPPRPLRHVRVVRGHEAPDLRAADRGRHRDRPERLRADPRRRSADRVLGRRPASGRAVHPRRTQPRERRRRDRCRPRRRHSGRRDRDRSPHLPGRPAPHRGSRDGRRCPLRERLEGDERRRGAPGDRGAARARRCTSSSAGAGRTRATRRWRRRSATAIARI